MAETIPEVIVNPGPSDYLQVMTRAVFQAGLSWAAIAKHWEQYLAAFDGLSRPKLRHIPKATLTG